MNDNAIRAIHTNVVTIIGDTAYDNSGDEVTIDEAQVNAWVDPNAWIEARILAYPPIGDQLDMQYHDSVNGTTTWADAITKVKTDNPKG